MNLEKIGKYIQVKRKKLNITQTNLADKLNVTNKTISRWENGNYMPDASLFKPLCDILGITISELLNGEDNKDKETINIKEQDLINYSNYLKKKSRNKILFLIIIILILIINSTSLIILSLNRTFFKTTYTSMYIDNVNIPIPRYSYYRSTNGIDIHTTKLKTLKQPDEVNIHIDRYLNTLEDFSCNNNTYYYNKKNNFTIIQYRINNDGIGFINTIYITYHDGKYCSKID